MDNYIASQRDHIFRNVEVLIYVFDVESREYDRDMQYYQSVLDAILANSKDAKIFCLIHKMDLVPESQREEVKDHFHFELVYRHGVRWEN
jgi:Ras-related GTP-binding protein A/B